MSLKVDFSTEGELKKYKAQPEHLVNYIWINETKYAPTDNDPPCGIPLSSIDIVIENAKNYNAQIKIWLDFDLLNMQSVKILSEHIQKQNVQNIEICDLRNIEFYKDCILFDPNRPSPQFGYNGEDEREAKSIWGRVDLARLLVIKHCMESTDYSDIFYADMDVEDLKLTSDKLKSCLEMYGMVFASCVDDPEVIENGFIGFRFDIFDDEFFCKLFLETLEAVSRGYDGYAPFFKNIVTWAGQNKLRGASQLTIQVTEPIGAQTPQRSEYKGVSI